MIYTYEDLIRLHVEKFGVEPKVTGAGFWDKRSMSERIIDAIESNAPYVEKEVKDEIVV